MRRVARIGRMRNVWELLFAKSDDGLEMGVENITVNVWDQYLRCGVN